MLSLILGGARSGKSAYAEKLAAQAGKEVLYLATAQALDGEMQARIAHHQAQRPSHWQVIEEPLALATCLQAHDRAGRLILVDCLTLWLSNLLYSVPQPDEKQVVAPARYSTERAALLAQLPQMQADVVLVSNEVGMGIVPLAASARWFVDEAGRLHQALASIADKVVFIAAGLPLTLKG